MSDTTYDSAKASADLKNKFTGREAEDFPPFILEVQQRAKDMGWDKNILVVTMPNGKKLNILENYGDMSWAEALKAKRERWSSGTDKDRSQAIDMHKAIMSGVSDIALEKMTPFEEEIGEDGPALYMLLLQKNLYMMNVFVQSY
eukprot:CAMPEP_0194377596 /NCGR_PEP_ID=MMETSP0174-20130528/32025_1 /TAXON_ID=216777 /ORGANISM="Proboscia alata, Strain PI-D3" /LENGTH=143 /DNA_ID=CAMNT_0039159073 /DNA_START=104 /DNA_END=535 /DNA_ORIENTATION=+